MSHGLSHGHCPFDIMKFWVIVLTIKLICIYGWNLLFFQRISCAYPQTCLECRSWPMFSEVNRSLFCSHLISYSNASFIFIVKCVGIKNSQVINTTKSSIHRYHKFCFMLIKRDKTACSNVLRSSEEAYEVKSARHIATSLKWNLIIERVSMRRESLFPFNK